MVRCLEIVMCDTSTPVFDTLRAKVRVDIESFLRIDCPIILEVFPVIFLGRPLPRARPTVPFSLIFLCYHKWWKGDVCSAMNFLAIANTLIP